MDLMIPYPPSANTGENSYRYKVPVRNVRSFIRCLQSIIYLLLPNTSRGGQTDRQRTEQVRMLVSSMKWKEK